MATQMRVGIVKRVLPDCARAIVHFAQDDEQDSYELAVLQRNSLKNRHYHLPDVGEQVYVLLDDMAEEGIILGAIYSEADPPPITDLDKCHLAFADDTVLEYDRQNHLMAVNFADATALAYDASAHKLKVKVSASGTIEIECEGNVAISSAEVASINATKAINLTAPAIALNSASITCQDPDSTLGTCEAVFRGNLTLQGQRFIQNVPQVSIAGSLDVNGSIAASGAILDAGGNSNHHEHPTI